MLVNAEPKECEKPGMYSRSVSGNIRVLGISLSRETGFWGEGSARLYKGPQVLMTSR